MKRNISKKKKAGEKNSSQTPATVETGQQTPEVIQNIDLSMIQCNPFNPRKYRTDEDLEELKTSIVNFGIIQPVTVRRKDGAYEIVCGERRFCASFLAGLSTIPAIVKDYSDEEAMEISILENLQRRDINPLEEAISFGKLMEVRGYAIEELALKFGKTDKYIRSRMQLRNLTDEIAALLVREEITLSIALELSRFCQEIQQEVYREHLQDDSYSWRKLPAKDFRRLMENGYSMDLSNYEFNRDNCRNCRFNSSIYDLFSDGNCGICQNMECLRLKQAAFMASETARLMEEKKGMIAGICVVPNSFASAEVVDSLSETGCDIYEMSATPMPVIPIKPLPEDFTSETAYREAEVSYESSLEQHHAHTAQIEEMVQSGTAELVVDVSKRKPELCYRIIPITGGRQAEGDTVEKLRTQDRRNREIAFEKGVEEIKQLMRENMTPSSEFQPVEENLLYYIMLSSLRKENYGKMGINSPSMLTDEDKAGVLNSLTEEQKNIIRRDFIVRFLSDTSGERRQSHLLIEFASLHFPGEVNQIKQKQNEIYKKRHIRIEERILALQPVAGQQDAENAEVLPVEQLAESVQAEGQYTESVLTEETVSTGIPETVIAEIMSETATNDMALQPVQQEFAITGGIPEEKEKIPATAEETGTTDKEEPVFPEMMDEPDTDDTALYPGLPEHATIGQIPEQDEEMFNTVYEDSAA